MNDKHGREFEKKSETPVSIKQTGEVRKQGKGGTTGTENAGSNSTMGPQVLQGRDPPGGGREIRGLFVPGSIALTVRYFGRERGRRLRREIPAQEWITRNTISTGYRPNGPIRLDGKLSIRVKDSLGGPVFKLPACREGLGNVEEPPYTTEIGFLGRLAITNPSCRIPDRYRARRITLETAHAKTRALNDTAIKISAETYKYSIFRTARDYSNAKLEPPRYDLNKKYAPKKAVVTVVVIPPTRELGSAALSKQDMKIKELELQLAAANLRAENTEKLITDPLLLANHVCKETRVAEVFLSAVSRMPVREDLLYTYRTWSFNGCQKAMQTDVWVTLEASVDEDDLPKLLTVL
nr:uncharacterized protein LOC109184184 [Ipomoea batatas]